MSNTGHVYAKQTLNGLYTLYIDGVEVAISSSTPSISSFREA